jgi:sodium-dependent phosphate cotransporter
VGVLGVVALLYTFLVGVKTLEGSFKFLGGGFAKNMLLVGANPILGLLSGMLCTVLIQSSSATTSIVVGLVSSGSLALGGAVPMIMGANLGTSITNTLVSLGHVQDRKGFRKAFAAATVHDFFNILSVAVLLPIELATGILQRMATSLAGLIYGTNSGIQFKSPVKAAIKPVAAGIKTFVTKVLALEATTAGVTMAIIAGVIIVVALTLIVKITRGFVDSNKGDIIESLLQKNVFATVIFGTVLTFLVQSSSITTSLLVPLAGVGIVSLEAVFPVTIGANIGTTTTAMIAAMAGNVHGLAIAFVHFLFNIFGTLIWFAPPITRKAPLYMANKLGELTERNKFWGIAYIGVVFFIVPFGMWYILS